MHPRVLGGREGDADVVEAADAVVEAVEDGAEETGPVVERGRVERDPRGDQRGRRDQREPLPEPRRQRRRECEQHEPEPVGSLHAAALRGAASRARSAVAGKA